MKQLLIDEEAEGELTASVAFYEQRRAGLGLEFAEAAEQAVRAIHRAPEKWPLERYGSRRCVMRRFPFVIHYFETEEYVWIVAFAHTSRKPGYWRARL